MYSAAMTSRIIDAWIQHPTPRMLRDPMFDSLRRWTGQTAAIGDIPIEMTLGALDLAKMDSILEEKAPDYQGGELRLTIDDIQWRWFSTGEAFCKAILCLYAYFQPKSFRNNSLVNIDNSWLKQVNSKNYHHFFPRSYVCKNGYQDWQANNIVNISIVDDYLNKRKIRARAPSDYMKEFEKENPDLSETMKTHLIDDLDDYCIWENDYDRFIERRSQRILEELNKRLQPEVGLTSQMNESPSIPA